MLLTFFMRARARSIGFAASVALVPVLETGHGAPRSATAKWGKKWEGEHRTRVTAAGSIAAMRGKMVAVDVWRRLTAGLAFVLPAAIGACTTTMYAGPSRPLAEVALIESEDTTITAIDGQRIDRVFRGKYEVLPGVHVLAVKLNKVQSGVLSTTHYSSSGDLTVCFEAEAGTTYITLPRFGQNGRWQPQVVYASSRNSVDVPNPESDRRCLDLRGGGN